MTARTTVRPASRTGGDRRPATPGRASLLLVAAAAAAVGPLAAAREARAQIPPNGGGVQVGSGGLSIRSQTTDQNVVDPALSKHTPRAVAQSTTFFQGQVTIRDDFMTLFAVGRDGLISRRYSSRLDAWEDWVHHGNPTPDAPATWDIYLPVADDSGPFLSSRVRAFFAFGRPGTAFVGTPLLSSRTPATGLPRTFSWDQRFVRFRNPAVSTPEYLNPQATISYLDASLQRRLLVFGNSDVGEHSSRSLATHPLLELPPPGSLLEARHDHGRPSFGTNGAQARAAIVGPQGACTVALGPSDRRHFVLVKAEYGPGSGDDRVACRYHDGTAWSWQDLGAPERVGRNELVGAPLAVSYYDPARGAPRVTVFVVARNTLRNPFFAAALFSNDWVAGPGGGTWSGWSLHGPPAVGPIGSASTLTNVDFEMTSAVVWYDGNPSARESLRMDLFGYTGRPTNPAPGQATGRQAVHCSSRDGSSFQWGMDPLPIPEELRTTGSAVIDLPAYDRVAVFGRTTSGRIYEWSYTIRNGVHSGFVWRDLSSEPLVRQAVAASGPQIRLTPPGP